MKKEDSRLTVLIISMGFLFLYFVFSWKWAIIVSFFIGVVGILSLFLSQKIEWLWMKLAKLLGYVVPNILLTIVFFVLLLPISLLSKLFNKDVLMLSNKYDSYFVEIKKGFDKKNLEKTW